MKFKALMNEAAVRPFTAADMELASLPPDGKRLIRELAKRFPGDAAAVVGRDTFEGPLEVTSHSSASSSWYGDRRVRFLIWPGDLTVNGDLIDDDFDLLPLLVVRGNLTVRSWLRGGMGAFVGGSVRASGFVIGHYNDSALFVGGDLHAAGYVPRAKPYPDFPFIAPHQIGGRVEARKLDLLTASDDHLRDAFVDEVLCTEGEDFWLDEPAVIERVAAGQAVWRV